MTDSVDSETILNSTLRFKSDPWTPNHFYSHLIPPQKVYLFDYLCKEINKTSSKDPKLDKLVEKFVDKFETHELESPCTLQDLFI